MSKLITVDYVLGEVAKQEGWKSENDIVWNNFKINNYRRLNI